MDKAIDRRKDLTNWLKRLSGIVVLFGFWEVLSLFFPPVIVPSVERVFLTFSQLLLRGELWLPLSHTVTRVLMGVGLSILLGGGVGILAGLVKGIYEAIKPVVVIIENIPPIVWVIVAIIWFGLGAIPPVFAIISLAVPIISIHLAQGIRDIDPSLREMAHSFNVKISTKLYHLYLPAITGTFFSALSVGFGLTWRVVVMAEFFGSMSGIGNQLNWARFNLETDKAFAYTILVVSLGLMTEYLVIRPLQNWATRWRIRK
ncbi:MAG: ABC transporter permease [Deltaproteobacteria bacterium]|nr:ABC transporter permease [Deltaproteobacteria bacterium]